MKEIGDWYRRELENSYPGDESRRDELERILGELDRTVSDMSSAFEIFKAVK